MNLWGRVENALAVCRQSRSRADYVKNGQGPNKLHLSGGCYCLAREPSNPGTIEVKKDGDRVTSLIKLRLSSRDTNS